jgi:hypothetical protein
MDEVLYCYWCNRPFRARQNGGKPQRFCQPHCRRAFHAGARDWALDAIACGALTVIGVKRGVFATRTLVEMRGSQTLVSATAQPFDASAASPRQSCHTAQENLERAMAEAIAMRRRG